MAMDPGEKSKSKSKSLSVQAVLEWRLKVVMPVESQQRRDDLILGPDEADETQDAEMRTTRGRN